MKRVRWTLLLVVLLGSLGAWLYFRWLERERNRPYSLVEDRLYVGELAEEPPPGTDAMVNLCGFKDPYEVDALLWEPILEGGEAPDLKWLRRVVRFIDTHRQAGGTVYVHCLGGMNRSGAVVTAYLTYEHHWPLDRALEFLQSKRPVIQPNRQLMRLLAEWEYALQDEAR